MPSSNKREFSLTWQAPEFRHYEKTMGWYVTLVAIAALIVGFFIVQKDIFAAVTIAILAFFVVLFSRKIPETVNVEISSKGISFGNLQFLYKQIKHFWVVNNERHKTLNFHTNTYFNNIIIIELEQQDPEIVQEYLSQYLPEHPETNETFAQRIAHKLKF